MRGQTRVPLGKVRGMDREKLLQAVEDTERGLFLQAGAGTGKTHWMAERYLKLLERGHSPLEVVAVTFTDKAALELRNRVRKRLLETAAKEHPQKLAELEAAPIGTLHALAARICREFPEEAEVPADFQVLDDLEAALLRGEWVEEALGEELQGAQYRSLLDAVGYEGLLETLERILEDPLAARELLEKGDAVWQDLRRRAWAKYYHLVRERLPRDLDGVPGLRDAWQGAKEGDPETASDLLNWASDVDSRKSPWKELKSKFPCLSELRGILDRAKELLELKPRPADNRLWEVWPAFRALVEGVLRRLEEYRFRARRLGYADLEVHALRALEKGHVREHYRARFRHLIVDEFQDTNPVQYRLLRTLFPDLRSWSVVGDPNQSIYGFRRADPRIMAELRREAEGQEGNVRVLSLGKTYRYHESLARFHNSFFKERLPDYVPVEADRSRTPEDAPVLFFEGKLKEQAHFIAQEVARLRKEFVVWDPATGVYRPLEYRDVAVLGRTWAHLAQVAEVLQGLGVPAVEARGGNLLETPEFLDAYMALRFLADPKDEEALLRLFHSPFLAVSQREVLLLSSLCGEQESLWDALSRVPNLPPSLERARRVLGDLLRRRAFEAPSRLLQRLDEATGYTGVVASLSRGRRRVKDWEGVLELVRELEVGDEDPFLVVRKLRRLLREGVQVERPPLEAGDALALLTVHAAKGLEWPVVFVLHINKWNGHWGARRDKPLFRPGLALIPPLLGGEDSSFFQLAKAALEEEERAEEERLLYVAATRARERLYLLLAPGGGHVPAAALECLGAVRRCLEAKPPRIEGVAQGQDFQPLTEGLRTIPLEAIPISLLPLAARDTGLARKLLLGEPLEGNAPSPTPVEDGEDTPRGAEVGAMAHTLLERLDCVEELEGKGLDLLERHFPGTTAEEREEALRLARTFLEAEVFAPFRKGTVAKEVPVALEVEGVRLEGRADRVGDDWVLDYKTDQAVDLENYHLQVALYAQALQKGKAYIADLRQGKLHPVDVGQAVARARGVLACLVGNLNGVPTEPEGGP